MKQKLTIIAVMITVLLLAGMPASAGSSQQPLVPPPDGPQPDGTIRLTGEFTSWPTSIYEIYKYGGVGMWTEYYCSIDGVYQKVALGPVNVYRVGGHFYYWLDVLPDDPTTAELEGPSAVGEGANFVYNWMPLLTASPSLGIRDRALKYTPDPDPTGPLPREVVQDLKIHWELR